VVVVVVVILLVEVLLLLLLLLLLTPNTVLSVYLSPEEAIIQCIFKEVIIGNSG